VDLSQSGGVVCAFCKYLDSLVLSLLVFCFSVDSVKQLFSHFRNLMHICKKTESKLYKQIYINTITISSSSNSLSGSVIKIILIAVCAKTK
jgi:NADH:ubiquinone oxidoreductase subunit K